MNVTSQLGNSIKAAGGFAANPLTLKPARQTRIAALLLAVVVGSGVVACSTGERARNHAKESAAHYWQDKAYPGKGLDIQVVDAEPAEGDTWRVKGIVDGETRVGVFSPTTETFSEGYYSLASERNKKIAELEQELKYWKEKYDSLEKENYKLKVKLEMDASPSVGVQAPKIRKQ